MAAWWGRPLTYATLPAGARGSSDQRRCGHEGRARERRAAQLTFRRALGHRERGFLRGRHGDGIASGLWRTESCPRRVTTGRLRCRQTSEPRGVRAGAADTLCAACRTGGAGQSCGAPAAGRGRGSGSRAPSWGGGEAGGAGASSARQTGRTGRRRRPLTRRDPALRAEGGRGGGC